MMQRLLLVLLGVLAVAQAFLAPAPAATMSKAAAQRQGKGLVVSPVATGRSCRQGLVR
jgi:hypothetical protein